MNDKPTINPQILPPLTRFIYTLGQLPTSYLMSMTYQEQVTWLCNYLGTQVIPAVNQNGEAVEELQKLYELLRTYVNDYFDNLDVQEEINNKLDELVANGTITRLIKQYIDPIQKDFEDDINERITKQDNQLSQMSSQINSVLSGAPLKASSTAQMTDTSRIYVNTTDGKWYYYDGDSWKIGGTYQSSVDNDLELSNELIIDSASNKIRITYAPEFTPDKRLDASGNLYNENGVSTSNYLPYKNCFNLHFVLPSNLANSYICYYDKNYALIGSRKTLDAGTNKNNEIPNNTQFFRFCVQTSEIVNTSVSADTKLNERITELEKNVNLYSHVNTMSKYITTNIDIGAKVSFTPTSATNYRYIILDCSEGDIFRIIGKGGNNGRLWAFIDKDNLLLSKSDYINVFSTNYCVAPENAAKVIINLYIGELSDDESAKLEITKLTSFNIENMENGYNIADTDILRTYGHINLGVNVGESVNLTPVTTGGWEYIIFPIKDVKQVYIAGSGGTGPRLWGFLDSNNKLVSKSAPELIYEGIVNVPYNANKLIINYKTSGKRIFYIITKPNLSQLEDRVVNNEDFIDTDYTYIKTSPDRAMCSAVRGLKLRNELNNPLTDFKKPTDTMVHVSTFKIVNDEVFVTYFASNTSVIEDPRYHIARFVKAPLNNLDNKTYYDIISVGDSFDGKEVTGVYDTILVKVDDDTLHIMICLMLNNRYTRVYVPYTISTGQFGEMQYNYFRVNQTRMIFNTTNMQTLLDNAGIPHNVIPQGILGEDIGIMQKFTPHVENEVTYYYSGCYIGTFNFIIKTTDFITFDYVAQPTWKANYWVENSVYVIGDIAYYYLRQKNEEQAGVLSRYYINENRWDTPVYVPEAQSRGDFLQINGALYLFHNKHARFTMSVLAIDTEYLNRSIDYIDCCVNFLHYPYTEIYNNKIYMIYSQSREHIYFKDITLGDDNDYISDKLFNDIYGNY